MVTPEHGAPNTKTGCRTLRPLTTRMCGRTAPGRAEGGVGGAGRRGGGGGGGVPRGRGAAVQPPPPQPAAPPPAGSRRVPPAAAAALAAVLALALAVAGCASFDATFGQREAVVQFQPQTTNAVRLKVRAACADVPHATPEPLPTGQPAMSLSYDV